MNLKQMFSIWRRRWVLTTALLILALLGTAAATQVLPKKYQAQSTVTLLPSTNFSKTNGNNPYLSFDGSLPVTAQLISFQLMDPRMVQNLADEGYSATYTSAPAVNSTGPVLQTVVVGSNKALVEHTLRGVTNEIGTELASLQSGIPNPNNKITVETLAFDPKPTLQVSKTARPIVVVLFFGLVLALAIPLIVDGQRSRSQKLAKSRKPARRAVRGTAPGVPGPRSPAPPPPSASPAPSARPEPAAKPMTSSAASPEWASQPAEPGWASKLAEQEWASKPAEQEWASDRAEQWLPTTPAARQESAAKPDWPAAPAPARTEWPAAPVPRPSRPEWVGKPATPQAERNGADTQNGTGTSDRTESPAKPASLFGSDRDEPAKPAPSVFERDRDEPAKPAPSVFEPDWDEPAKPASSRFQRDEPSKPASSRFHRDDEEPAKPASSRFHRDDDEESAKPATPMPRDEDRAQDASPAGGGDNDSSGKNGSGKDHHDRETVTVPAGHTSSDDLDDDGPATQPQERVT